MVKQELRELLKKSSNKIDILTDIEIIKKYELKVVELCELIEEFLSEQEKFNLFSYQLYKDINVNVKSSIIKTISDDKIIVQILNNEEIMKDFFGYQILDIIKKMGSEGKIQILRNQELIKKYEISEYDLSNIISELEEESKIEVIQDTELIEKLKLKDFHIKELILHLSSDKDKENIMNMYNLETFSKAEIIKTFEDKRKMEILLNYEGLQKWNALEIMQSLNTNSICDFLNKNGDYLTKDNIYPYQIICKLEKEKQMEFFKEIENVNLTLNEKREILALLDEEVKKQVDTSKVSEELRKALDMKKADYLSTVVLDLDGNPEDYVGLDRILNVKPLKFDKDQRKKLMKFCEVCPEMTVISNMGEIVTFESTAKEYKEAEEWIEEVIGKIDSQYSVAQKIAVIDNQIGKKISYSPDFDTEIFSKSDCRALWKIISTGYGVCNGIAYVEQYILDRMGIESEVVDSDVHAFLKLNDIEVCLASGESVRGNTILDPTWNLAAHRYGCKPNNFFINYEEARKNDIDSQGKDHEAHKNDKTLEDATLMLDEQSLRNLFLSVNLADKDGQFPIKEIIEQSKEIDSMYSNNLEINLNKQLQLLQEKYPEFATCQESTMVILSDILLSNENMKFEKCVVNRVYKKDDKEKRPVMYIYSDFGENKNKFYYANNDEGKFIEMSRQEFTKEFECYDTDLRKLNGIRPWENNTKEMSYKDITKSSGTIMTEKGEER